LKSVKQNWNQCTSQNSDRFTVKGAKEFLLVWVVICRVLHSSFGKSPNLFSSYFPFHMNELISYILKNAYRCYTSHSGYRQMGCRRQLDAHYSRNSGVPRCNMSAMAIRYLAAEKVEERARRKNPVSNL
jgi:hypothetical protein